MAGAMSAHPLAVIIPALNEAACIEATIASARTFDKARIIVADGGSHDSTVHIAREAGATVIITPPGRALQMNAAARIAYAQTLLFLHADTRLPPRYEQEVFRVLSRPNVAAGAFRLRMDGPSLRLRMIAAAANVRSRCFQWPYGDQALFMHTELFDAEGGYPDAPVMEDLALVRKLKRRGRIVLANAFVSTSARRYTAVGPLRLAMRHQAMVAGYLLGVPPGRLAKWRG